MMLAIETATDACSVAIGDGARVLMDHHVAPRQHNRLVLQMIDDLLVRAGVGRTDLSALAIGRGPGSFTGVRIAASIAQGLALALGLPVACISTLEVLAHGALRAVPTARGVVAAIGSTPAQHFLGAFAARDGRLARVVDDCSLPTATALPVSIADDWIAAGPSSASLCALARSSGRALQPSGVMHPSADDLIVLGMREIEAGRGVDAQGALPVYLDGDGPWRKRTR